MDPTIMAAATGVDLTELGPHALAIGAVVYLLRKSPLWKKIPHDWAYLVPVAFGLCDLLISYLAMGKDPAEAAKLAAVGTLAAIGGHKWLKDSPAPYGEPK